jgi:hypothetical protein
MVPVQAGSPAVLGFSNGVFTVNGQAVPTGKAISLSGSAVSVVQDQSLAKAGIILSLSASSGPLQNVSSNPASPTAVTAGASLTLQAFEAGTVLSKAVVTAAPAPVPAPPSAAPLAISPATSPAGVNLGLAIGLPLGVGIPLLGGAAAAVAYSYGKSKKAPAKPTVPAPPAGVRFKELKL